MRAHIEEHGDTKSNVEGRADNERGGKSTRKVGWSVKSCGHFYIAVDVNGGNTSLSHIHTNGVPV